MSIFGKLFGKSQAPTEERASLENPGVQLTPENLLLGLQAESEAGVIVTTGSAMRFATVFSCVRIISQTIATVKREVHEIDDKGVSRPINNGLPLIRALTIEPNEYMSAYDFFAMLQAHAELWGNAYAAIERNGRGEVVNLIPLISQRVTPVRESGKLIYHVNLMGPENEFLSLPSSEVVHVRGTMLDGLIGLAPIAQGKDAIGLSVAAENYGARFFRNDARPSIALKHEKTLSEGAAKRLKESWIAFYGGRNQGSPAVLEEGLDFKEIGIAPEQAQFLETRKFQRQEIAAMFQVPLSMLADPDAQTYRSGEWDDLRFTKHAILPRTKAWEGEMNRKLFPRGSNRRIVHDLRELERGAFSEQMSAITSGIQNAVFTPNEGRARLGLPPLPGGDSLFLQQNMAGVSAVADGTAGNNVTNAAEEPQDAKNKEAEKESDNDKEDEQPAEA